MNRFSTPSVSSKRFSVAIDTTNRISGSLSDFIIAVRPPIGLFYDTVVLTEALIPHSWYTLEAGYNYFTLTEDPISGPQLITLPPGNYNRRSISLTLTTLLNARAGVNAVLAGRSAYVYTVSFDDRTISPDRGILSFSVIRPIALGANAGLSTLTFDAITDAAMCMGFSGSTSNTLTAGSGGPPTTDTLDSPNVVSMQTISQITVTTELCKYSTLTTMRVSDDGFYSSIEYQCVSPKYQGREINKSSRSDDIQDSYGFQFRSNRGRLVDFHGLPASLTLTFYNTEDFYNIASNFFLLKTMLMEDKNAGEQQLDYVRDRQIQ
jgi:hypothetical protein